MKKHTPLVVVLATPRDVQTPFVNTFFYPTIHFLLKNVLLLPLYERVDRVNLSD